MAKKKLEVLNVAGFAQLMGVAPNTVTKWINTGKITQKSIEYNKAGKPQIIVDYAVPELQKNETPGAVRRTKTGLNFGGNTKPSQKVKPPPGKDAVEALLSMVGLNQNGEVEIDGVSIMEAEATDYHTAKIQEQIGKAELIKLVLKEKRGELVDKEKQAQQFALLGTNLKSYLDTLADRIAAPVYATARNGTELDTRNIIHEAVRFVLAKFSGKIWE